MTNTPKESGSSSINNRFNRCLDKLFPRYCVQFYKKYNDNIASGGGTGELTLEAAKKEMKRLTKDGFSVTLHKDSRLAGGGWRVNYPAIEEFQP